MAKASDAPIPEVYFCSRRQALLWIGCIATSLAGCRRFRRSQPSVSFDSIMSNTGAYAATPPSCVLRPEQTEGPYFVDEKLNRSDIRIDPSDHSIRAGVPLRLQFNVSRIAHGVCEPLSGAIIDVWHCDAAGVYSDVRENGLDTRGKKFLRGYQMTDAGFAQFTTIYPGWYGDRAVHIHFKIRTDPGSPQAREFISQLYFDEAITDQVHQQAPYNRRGRRSTVNDQDFIYRRGGKQLIPELSRVSQGYTAKFDIGLQLD